MKTQLQRKAYPLVLAGWVVLLSLNLGGCGSAGGGTARTARSGKEEWTIRCTRIETPDHQAKAKLFADLLGRVSGLKAGQVQVTTDARGSTIYYGRYEKRGTAGGDLVFPDQYQKDIELIRSLAYREQTPFFFAAPELLSSGEGAGAEGEVSTAKGTHALLIALFYNTATFTERKESAEIYVRDLRSRGYPAYYYHEPARSLVYVGDFDESDLVMTNDGRKVPGPRVEQFIARNPDEFKIQTENGHIVRRTSEGTTMVSPSVFLPLPGRGSREEAPRMR